LLEGVPVTDLIYFSSVSDNTHRFLEKLSRPATRLPKLTSEDTVLATEPYVLVLPTYGGGGEGGAVPKQVIKFLNDEANRNLIRGVIATGNTNFGEAFCLAGDIISRQVQRTHCCIDLNSWAPRKTWIACPHWIGATVGIGNEHP
jgi:protein involved in ribonucleotide reduction